MEVIVFDRRDNSESGSILLFLILILVILAIVALSIWIVQQLS